MVLLNIPRWLVVGVAWNLLAISFQVEAAPRRIAIQVRETAGIRRFGYPVTVHVFLPPGSLHQEQQARLVNREGKPVPAQMTATSKHPDGSLNQLEVDLNLSPGPLETIHLAFEYGDGIMNAEPKQGLTFSETADTYQVSAYTIRKDAQPLISNIRYGREYLKPGGIEIVAWTGEVEHSLRAARRQWTVEKRGPFQVRLRCEGVYASQGDLPEFPFSLTLEFVSTKSWVGLRHSVHPTAAADRPLALGTAAHFQLSSRLLWDLDVDYWLYGVLEEGEQMTFSQRQDSWLCEQGKVGKETAYAASTASSPGAKAPRSKGWGHFQESRADGNVIAFGLNGSAATEVYSSRLTSEGKMLLRGTASGSEDPQLNTFFHFIPVPAQHTARTSPAAMMSPLVVTSAPAE